MTRRSMTKLLAASTFGLGAIVGCGSNGDSGSEATVDSTKLDPGALVSVAMSSQVGVLLDEIPASQRSRVAAALIARPQSFWINRAHRQITLTYYRLVFRPAFYPTGVLHGKANATGQSSPTGNTQKQQLPLPPETQWNVTLSGAPQRVTVDGHDIVAVNYNFASTILTDVNSPGISEQSLANGGGNWGEPFTFPIDPELIFQRTRFACMDEAEFPPGSVDSEEMDSFFDSTCTVEPNLSPQGCHQTELPPWDCVDALKAKIGHVDTKLQFTRLKWDASLADSVRSGPISPGAQAINGADLVPETPEFKTNRVTYRYIAPNDCAITEQCVAGTGWRKLLQFATADRNIGTAPLNIGWVDYFNDDGGSDLSNHNVFEYSACHKHYHFMHYGTFSFNNDAALTTKRGFCLQSTNRLSNNEFSPLHNPYADCHYQGVEVGWVDEYKAGLPCQWIDVTSQKSGTSGPLKFVSNPDGFLCEGAPVLDANGNQTWTPTNFTSSTGQPVDKPACTYSQGWFDNNTDQYNVTLPNNGDGYVTGACSHDQLGPLRNCGMSSAGAKLATCTPGAKVTVQCTVAAGSAPQVARICEGSKALGTGVACTFQDALANATVEAGAGTAVTFTCPAKRDSVETGGAYAVYGGAVFADDKGATITCK